MSSAPDDVPFVPEEPLDELPDEEFFVPFDPEMSSAPDDDWPELFEPDISSVSDADEPEFFVPFESEFSEPDLFSISLATLFCSFCKSS